MHQEEDEEEEKAERDLKRNEDEEEKEDRVKRIFDNSYMSFVVKVKKYI